MDSIKNYFIDNNSISKNNELTKNKQYLDESDTNENSLKLKNENSIEEINKDFKKSMGFFSKKSYIEKPEQDNKKRKYSFDEKSIIKNFVPKIKPININLVPSKLILNKSPLKSPSNISFCSCPNSEEDEESDFFLNIEKNENNDINITRKNLKKLKNSDNLSKSFIESKNENYEDELFNDYDSHNEYKELGQNLLYNDTNYINIHLNGDSNKDNKNNINRKNRINSCLILDVLKKRLSFDETI